MRVAQQVGGALWPRVQLSTEQISQTVPGRQSRGQDAAPRAHLCSAIRRHRLSRCGRWLNSVFCWEARKHARTPVMTCAQRSSNAHDAYLTPNLLKSVGKRSRGKPYETLRAQEGEAKAERDSCSLPPRPSRRLTHRRQGLQSSQRAPCTRPWGLALMSMRMRLAGASNHRQGAAGGWPAGGA